MDQKISVKIAGGTYNLTAHTPEQEQLYRLAAEVINKRFATYTRSHPGKTTSDILSMVALNETVVRLGLQQDIDRYAGAEKQLEEDLARYLQDNSVQ